MCRCAASLTRFAAVRSLKRPHAIESLVPAGITIAPTYLGYWSRSSTIDAYSRRSQSVLTVVGQTKLNAKKSYKLQALRKPLRVLPGGQNFEELTQAVAAAEKYGIRMALTSVCCVWVAWNCGHRETEKS